MEQLLRRTNNIVYNDNNVITDVTHPFTAMDLHQQEPTKPKLQRPTPSRQSTPSSQTERSRASRDADAPPDVSDSDCIVLEELDDIFDTPTKSPTPPLGPYPKENEYRRQNTNHTKQ
eukprot:m.114863 g.114863  ORF g.114863 m.114863 type:complete len:117 (+) comp37521_c0_seq2:1003-1353(+)